MNQLAESVGYAREVHSGAHSVIRYSFQQLRIRAAFEISTNLGIKFCIKGKLLIATKSTRKGVSRNKDAITIYSILYTIYYLR